MEALAENVLIARSIPYLFEYKIGRFCIDFLLPTLGVALECDGWQHFSDFGIAKDARRDVYLNARGWRVVHLHFRDLMRDADRAIVTALSLE